MSNIRIGFRFPLDFGNASVTNHISVQLSLPEGQTRIVSLREVPGAPAGLTGREQYVVFDGLARIRLTISDGVGHFVTFTPPRQPLRFAIGIGEPIDYTPINPPFFKTTPLLLGSIAIDSRVFFLDPNLVPLLRRCWPTGRPREIRQFRFEPSGFYLVGDVPGEWLPDFDGQWALRVPQPKLADSPTVEQPEVQPPVRTPNSNMWELTAEEFRFEGRKTLNAVSFIEMIDDQFRQFSSGGAKMLDSVITNPDPNADRDSPNPAWTYPLVYVGDRYALVVGNLKAGETSFEPNLLCGEIKSTNLQTWRHEYTIYADAKSEADVNPVPSPESVSLTLVQPPNDINPPEPPQLTFPDSKIVGLNVPTVKTEADENDADNREEVKRAWICLQQGWLGIDADQAGLDISANAAIPGRMGIIGVNRLMASFADDASESQGFELRLLPLRDQYAAVAITNTHQQRDTMSLSVEAPLKLLTTPPMWYLDEPAVRVEIEDEEIARFSKPRDWVPSLAWRLELTGSVEEDGVDPISDDRSSRRGGIANRATRLREILRQADWISEGAVDDAPTSQTRFQATIRWNGDEFKLSFPVTKQDTVFWDRPGSVPVIRTYPQWSSQVPTALLEDQRGLIPYRLRQDSAELAVQIPKATLPQLEDDLPNFEVATSPRWVPVVDQDIHFMLPTLPGAEATIEGDVVSWRMRHAPPVLDESYRETRESKTALESPVDQNSIDITRIEEGVAFAIETATDHANWLHIRDEAANALTITSFSPRGANPALEFQLANGADHRFSRNDDESAGLTQPIDVTATRTGGAPLPTFGVVFGDADSNWEIRRNGQPLIFAKDDSIGISTLDGRGTVRGEPVSGKSLFRPHDEPNELSKLTATFQNAQHALEFIGIERAEFENCHDPLAQQWTFHDGQGDWPQLFGFGLIPLKHLFASDEAVTLSCELVPMDVLQLPNDRSPRRLIKPSSNQLQLDFDLASGSPGTLSLSDVRGSFRWRFGREIDAPVFVAGVSGRVDSLAADHLLVKITEIVLQTPLGVMRLNDLDIDGRIQDGTLAIPQSTHTFPALGERIGVTATIGELTIESDAPAAPGTGEALPTAVESYSFKWTQPDSWELELDQDNWHFRLTLDDATELEYELRPSQVGKRNFVFGATRTGTDFTSEQSFFELTKSNGILNANFSTSTYLGSLNGELLFGFQSKLDNSDMLAGRLKFSSANFDPVLETTGSFAIPNRVSLTAPGGPIAHAVRVFVDQGRFPLDSLIQGTIRVDADTAPIAVVVEHSLEFADNKICIWQSAQWLFLRSMQEFQELYSPQAPQDLPASSLVIDAGAVFWLQDPKPLASATTVDLPDVENREYSVALKVRAAETTVIDRPGMLVRLPFASVFANEVLHEIAVDLEAEGLPMDSRGAQHRQLRFAISLPEHELRFFRRSSAAVSINAERLASGLRPLQPEHGALALPAFENASGDPTHYPATLEDLAELVRTIPEPGSFQALAAGIVRRYPVKDPATPDGDLYKWWERNGQFLLGSTLMELPVKALQMAAGDGDDANAVDSVQLLAISDQGGFELLAEHDLISGVDEIEWARAILDRKPRDVVAVILKNRSEFVVIPSDFENLREQMPDAWEFESLVATIKMDPRLIIPRHLTSDGHLVQFAAAPNEGLYVWHATIPRTEETNRPVTAATHFRIASIHGGIALRSMLRPARAGATNGKQALSWSQMDNVSFEASSQGTYPAIDALTLSNVPVATSLPPENSDTLVTPMMHCISWAARPGEMSTTTWACEAKEVDEGNSRQVVSRSAGTVATLRRARAQAGRFESVRLVPTDEPGSGSSEQFIFAKRFVSAQFDLEQTLGRTPVPEPAALNGVLVTPETFYASHENMSDAKQDPALVYAAADELPAYHLELFADPDFDPDKIAGQGSSADIATRSFAMIGAAGAEAKLPANFPNGGSPFPNDDLRNLVEPQIPELTDVASWKTLTGGTVRRLNISGIAEKANELDPSETQFEILVVRYLLNPDDDLFHLGPIEMAVTLKLLDKNAAIIAPKTSVTLLAIDSPQDSYVVGYGRLSPDDFSPPGPQFGSDDGGTNSFINWLKYSRLNSLDRWTNSGNASTPNRTYDVVVYGSGGELLPTRSN